MRLAETIKREDKLGNIYIMKKADFDSTYAEVKRSWLCYFVQFKISFLFRKYITIAGVKCVCGGCKMSRRTTSLCSHIFLVLKDHGVYMFVVNI